MTYLVLKKWNVFGVNAKSFENSFYSPLKKKNNLPTFKNMAAKVVVNPKEKSATIAAERSLFGRHLILAKSREFFLEFVWSFSLSPIPAGDMVKTCKSRVLGVFIIQCLFFYTKMENNGKMEICD